MPQAWPFTEWSRTQYVKWLNDCGLVFPGKKADILQRTVRPPAAKSDLLSILHDKTSLTVLPVHNDLIRFSAVIGGLIEYSKFRKAEINP